MDSVIIIAGGSGHRLWPYSSTRCPKHLLPLGEHGALITDTVHRALALKTPRRVVIVTHCSHVDGVLAELAGLSSEQREKITILAEPEARNTAPALALAGCYLNSSDARGSAICLPADHIIKPTERFREDVAVMEQLIGTGLIGIFGISPLRAETGYGYIEVGEHAPPSGYRVRQFHEKPDAPRALQYLKAGTYYWNSGIYAFDSMHFWQELGRHEPAITQAFDATGGNLFEFDKKEGMSVQRVTGALTELYQGLPKISIDYALAERSEHMGMVAASFKWYDLGSWDEVARLIGEKVLGQISSVEHRGVESENNTVISDVPVGLCGVEDLLVVAHQGRVLVCKRGKSQKIQDISVHFRKNEKTE